jgi:hypothetical protein
MSSLRLLVVGEALVNLVAGHAGIERSTGNAAAKALDVTP